MSVALQGRDARLSWLCAAHGEDKVRAKRWMDRARDVAAANPTGLAVTWLGTSSGAPTAMRNTSGVALRAGAGPAEAIMLVDAGAALQQTAFNVSNRVLR